ncbi:MAG: phytanoyl-CoA dioxygenase family protein, partial [Hyphomonadaceae bacterium]
MAHANEPELIVRHGPADRWRARARDGVRIDPSGLTRPVSAEAVAAAHQEVVRVRERLSPIADWVKIEHPEGEALYVKGDEGLLQRAAPDAPIGAVIAAHPADLTDILHGVLEPRRALFFGQIKVGGRVSLAIRFCDVLSGCIQNLPDLAAARLPKPTKDRAQAKADLDEYGYCLVAGALSPAQVRALRARVVEQAAAEAEAGINIPDGGVAGANQRVWNLINKGRVFEDLLLNPVIEEFTSHVLGEHAILSSISANIAGPGGEREIMHYDQMSIQPRPGDAPLGVNVLFFLDDVCEENGGTRLMPGSHRPGIAPFDPYSSEGTVAAEGPAGTALILDSLFWHGTGANRT